MEDRELKDREVEIKREIEELFVDDIDKFEKKKEMKKTRPIKTTWYDWLIDYISEPIRKSPGGFKDKVISLFKINIPKTKSVWWRKETNQI